MIKKITSVKFLLISKKIGTDAVAKIEDKDEYFDKIKMNIQIVIKIMP